MTLVCIVVVDSDRWWQGYISIGISLHERELLYCDDSVYRKWTTKVSLLHLVIIFFVARVEDTRTDVSVVSLSAKRTVSGNTSTSSNGMRPVSFSAWLRRSELYVLAMFIWSNTKMSRTPTIILAILVSVSVILMTTCMTWRTVGCPAWRQVASRFGRNRVQIIAEQAIFHLEKLKIVLMRWTNRFYSKHRVSIKFCSVKRIMSCLTFLSTCCATLAKKYPLFNRTWIRYRLISRR